MKVIYRAEDGTEFANEFECQMYERIHNGESWFKLFDAEGNEMTPEYCAEHTDELTYFAMGGEYGWKLILDFLNENKIDISDYETNENMIDDKWRGLWMWSDSTDSYECLCWKHINDITRVVDALRYCEF